MRVMFRAMSSTIVSGRHISDFKTLSFFYAGECFTFPPNNHKYQTHAVLCVFAEHENFTTETASQWEKNQSRAESQKQMMQ